MKIAIAFVNYIGGVIGLFWTQQWGFHFMFYFFLGTSCSYWSL